ncbi:ankyrin repeat domain-containing protein [Rhodopirellula baltica]|uniref:Ankyrin n=1 Tax=Rhodopirellula baltica SWK14 TaxID=993516 RepID=L7C9I6_RHOBT|nr:ankyrin repeat domain-containing protein [Rhodopirellula baltica]ELP30839.1 Ankyrin [Rhodopirellula baltica SWK14]
MLPEYQLFHAIESGCRADLSYALLSGTDIAAKDLAGRGVLEVALKSGQPEMARELIQLGADPNGAIGKREDRLIHRAAQTGDIGILSVLLGAGVCSDSIGTRRKTPLHFVAEHGFQFMAQTLLDNDANPDATDAAGNTPLHFAGRLGDLPMVKLLLKHHATATITNNELYTPIHDAAAAGHTEVAQAMLQHEDSLSSRFRSSSIPDRVRKVAERHGQLETAMAIQDTWLAPA